MEDPVHHHLFYPSTFVRTLCVSLALFIGMAASAAQWAPVNMAELADNTPKVDPEAGAEYLLREVEMDHSKSFACTDRYYCRVKICSQRGIEDFAKIEIPFGKGSSIRDIAARTIKPDGTIAELKPSDVFEREIIKAGNVRQRVRSFAPPAVEVGSIIEYRYTEKSSRSPYFVMIFFQANHPARLVRYRVKLPTLYVSYDSGIITRLITSNCPDMALVADSAGYYTFQKTDMAAVREEPFQPPVFNTTAALMLYYTVAEDVKPVEFWKKHSDELYIKAEKLTKTTKLVRSTLEGIVAPTDTEDRKLAKIYDYCRTKILNRMRTDIAPEIRKRWKENDNTTDVLKSGSGSREEINLAFVALAKAAGFDARLAVCADRTDIEFDAKIIEGFLLPDSVAAVRRGDKWVLYDPGMLFLPPGMLSWWNSDTAVLITAKSPELNLINVPGNPCGDTTNRRTAVLRLDSEGTLEGDVQELFTGYREAELRNELGSKTVNEQADYVREGIQEHQKQAEVTNIKVENADNVLKPFRLTYHLRIPGYADATGNRLFFQPAVFQKGIPPLFSDKTRRTNITFDYRYTSIDSLTINLPEGYELEQASAPQNFTIDGLAEYQTAIRYKPKTRQLFYDRTFSLTGLVFPRNLYPEIKLVFDEVAKLDGHTLAMKRKDEPATAGTSDPATGDAASGAN